MSRQAVKEDSLQGPEGVCQVRHQEQRPQAGAIHVRIDRAGKIGLGDTRREDCDTRGKGGRGADHLQEIRGRSLKALLGPGQASPKHYFGYNLLNFHRKLRIFCMQGTFGRLFKIVNVRLPPGHRSGTINIITTLSSF